MAKFTKEEALAACKAKFANNEGSTPLKLSDRTFSESLDSVYDLIGDEMELDVFIDKHFFPGMDSANRNIINTQSDIAKAHEEEMKKLKKEYEGKGGSGDGKKPEGFDMEEFKKILLETNQNAINEAIKPLQDEIATFREKESLVSRSAAINAKRDELKLSNSQKIDFDNSVELACAILGKDASADDIYKKAYEHFNDTLSKRGEKYEPKSNDGSGSGDADFSEMKKILDDRKKAQEEMNKV